MPQSPALSERLLQTHAGRLSTARGKDARQRSRDTHRVFIAIRLPKLDGRVPLSWLELMSLQTHAGRLSAARGKDACVPSFAGNAQKLHRSQVAHAGRNGAAEMVSVEVAANTHTRGASAPHARNTRAFLCCSRATHSSVNAVRLPKLDGMVPLSLL